MYVYNIPVKLMANNNGEEQMVKINRQTVLDEWCLVSQEIVYGC